MQTWTQAFLLCTVVDIFTFPNPDAYVIIKIIYVLMAVVIVAE